MVKFIDEDYEVKGKKIMGMQCTPLLTFNGCPKEYECVLWEFYEKGFLKGMPERPVVKFVDLSGSSGKNIAELTSRPCGELELRWKVPHDISVKDGILTASPN